MTIPVIREGLRTAYLSRLKFRCLLNGAGTSHRSEAVQPGATLHFPREIDPPNRNHTRHSRRHRVIWITTNRATSFDHHEYYRKIPVTSRSAWCFIAASEHLPTRSAEILYPRISPHPETALPLTQLSSTNIAGCPLRSLEGDFGISRRHRIQWRMKRVKDRWV